MGNWLNILLFGVLLGLLYHSAIAYLLTLWRAEDFNYGYAILPIVLYLLWEKRAELKRYPSDPSWRGLIPIGVGIFLYALGELGGEYTTLFLSLWLVIVGLCWMHLGWGKMKVAAFPLAFLLVMFPPPHLLYTNISLKLQLVSSWLGVRLMQMVGMAAYREGNIIDLGFTRLQVVEACSGLRYLFPLMALACLLAYHFRYRFWKGAVLVLFAIPVTIVTNSLRIASVGVLYQFFGQKVAEGFFHDFSGWLIFMGSLAILLLVVWGLNRLAPENHRPAEVQPPAPAGHPVLPYHSMVAGVLLLVPLVVFWGVEFREHIAIKRPLRDLPLTLGEWNGVPSTMDPQTLAFLKLSDYTILDYRDGRGKEVNVYVAYNGSQRKGASTHSPDTCLPGGGWIFQDSGNIRLPIRGDGGNTIRVSRAVMEKSGARHLSYYWFPQRGRILTTMYQLKAYAFWDALTQHRTDGALVRMITPVYESERTEDAEARLQRFAGQFVPILNGFLPGREAK